MTQNLPSEQISTPPTPGELLGGWLGEINTYGDPALDASKRGLQIDLAAALSAEGNKKNTQMLAVQNKIAQLHVSASTLGVAESAKQELNTLKADVAGVPIVELGLNLQQKVDTGEVTPERAAAVIEDRKHTLDNVTPYTNAILSGEVSIDTARALLGTIANADQANAIKGAIDKRTKANELNTAVTALNKQPLVDVLSKVQEMVEKQEITEEQARQIVTDRQKSINERLAIANERIQTGQVKAEDLKGANDPTGEKMAALTGGDPVVKERVLTIIASKLAKESLEKIVNGVDTAGKPLTPRAKLNLILASPEFREYSELEQQAIEESFTVEIAEYESGERRAAEILTAEESKIDKQRNDMRKLKWEQRKYFATGSIPYLAIAGSIALAMTMGPTYYITAMSLAAAGLIGLPIERTLTKTQRVDIKAKIDELRTKIPDLIPVRMKAERDKTLRQIAVAERCSQIGATIWGRSISSDPQVRADFINSIKTQSKEGLENLVGLLKGRSDFAGVAV
jgi:hypothetical protein